MSPIRIVVADDQAVVRDGLVTLLGLEPDLTVVAEAANGVEAVRVVREVRPDVVLMDLRMPLLDGAEATSRILAAAPGTAVLVLTTFADDASIAGALLAGARGYLTKDAGRRQLLAAVRAAAVGQATFAPEVGERIVRGFAPATPRTVEGLQGRFPALTRREAEVLLHVVAGLTNADIAVRLHLSVATVKSHINAIFSKLQVRDRAQAVALALDPR